jgi:hypothetical protein
VGVGIQEDSQSVSLDQMSLAYFNKPFSLTTLAGEIIFTPLDN